MSSRLFSNADQFTHITQHLYPLHSVIIALDELTYSMFIMNFKRMWKSFFLQVDFKDNGFLFTSVR